MTAREPRRLPSVDKLRELLKYDPLTGVLSWRDTSEAAGYLHTDRRGRVSVRIRVEGRECYAHRIAWKMHTGMEPPRQIDHNSGASTDNSWHNLSDGDGGRNRLNCASSGHNKTSGLTGVSWCNQKKRWRAAFTLGGVTKHVGFYQDLDLAFMDVMEARIDAGFSPRHGTGFFLAKHHREVVGHE